MTYEPEATGSGIRLGHLVGGLIVLVIGIAALLEALDVVTVSWSVVLAIALIVVGAALVGGSSTGRHAGLIWVGVLLTVAMTFATAFEVILDATFSGGVGERSIGYDDVDGRRLALGTLTIDLRGGDLEGTIEASVGIGELIIIVGDASAVEVTAQAGLGEVVIFGTTSGGLRPQLSIGSSQAQLHIIASVGIGKVEVIE